MNGAFIHINTSSFPSDVGCHTFPLNVLSQYPLLSQIYVLWVWLIDWLNPKELIKPWQNFRKRKRQCGIFDIYSKIPIPRTCGWCVCLWVGRQAKDTSFHFNLSLVSDLIGLSWDCSSIFGLVVILFWFMVMLPGQYPNGEFVRFLLLAYSVIKTRFVSY